MQDTMDQRNALMSTAFEGIHSIDLPKGTIATCSELVTLLDDFVPAIPDAIDGDSGFRILGKGDGPLLMVVLASDVSVHEDFAVGSDALARFIPHDEGMMTIFEHKDLADPASLGIVLLHELLHYKQSKLSGRTATSDEQHALDEYEAYILQSKIVRTHYKTLADAIESYLRPMLDERQKSEHDVSIDLQHIYDLIDQHDSKVNDSVVVLPMLLAIEHDAIQAHREAPPTDQEKIESYTRLESFIASQQ